MTNIFIQVFNYRVIFILELIIAMSISSLQLKKRSHFAKRVAVSVVILVAISGVLHLPVSNSISFILMFLLLFALMLSCSYLCFDEPIYNILFCGITAYTTQHIAFSTYNFIMTISGLSNYGDIYSEEGFTNINLISVLVYMLIYCLVYWMLWIFMSYLLNGEEDFDIGSGYTKLLLVFVIVLVDVVLNAVLVHGLGENRLPNKVYIVIYVQGILCCLLALAIHFTLLWGQQEKREAARIKELWNTDRMVYERMQENIDLVNIKCHDLKYQIREIREGNTEYDDESLRELEDAIAIYSCKVNTGNSVLDTILSERSLQCEYEHIRLVHMVDGALLNYISPNKLYSLFGNAIANAIEAVKKIDDVDKRLIHVNVYKHNEMVFIHFDNYCMEEDFPNIVNGFPETSKEDKKNHGYGLRSMSLLAEKLGGRMEYHIEDNLFNLNFFIPYV